MTRYKVLRHSSKEQYYGLLRRCQAASPSHRSTRSPVSRHAAARTPAHRVFRLDCTVCTTRPPSTAGDTEPSSPGSCHLPPSAFRSLLVLSVCYLLVRVDTYQEPDPRTTNNMTIMSSKVTNKQLSSTIYRTWHNQRSSSINARKQRIESKRRPSPVEQHLDTDTQPQTCGRWRCCRGRGGEDHIEYWPETRVARPGQHGHHQHQHLAQGRHGRYCQLPGYSG